MSAILLLITILAALQIETSEACKQKMDFCFILDSSTTVCGGNEPCDNWESTLEFCKNMTNTLDIGPNMDRVALETFANKTEEQWGLPQYTVKDTLLSAISGVPFKGGVFNDIPSTTILATKIFNFAYGDNLMFKDVALMITDGVPSLNDTIAETTSLAVQKYGITVFVIGILPGCTESWAKAVASKPEKDGLKTYFVVESYSLLYTVFDTVLENICYFLDDSSGSKPILNLNLNLTVG